MIYRRPISRVVLCICMLVGTMAFVGPPAQAFVTHQYIPGTLPQLAEGVPAKGPHGETIPLPGPLSFDGASIALDSGHLWLAETFDVNGNGAHTYRLDEFDASTGAFIAQLTHSEWPNGESPRFGERGLAIGHIGGETRVYMGEELGIGESRVAVFDEAGTTEKVWKGAGTPAGSFAKGVADVAIDNSRDPLDEHKGDLYVTDRANGVVDIFRPEADGEEHYVGQITAASISGLPASETFEPAKLVVSEANGDIIVENHSHYDILEPDAFGAYQLVAAITGTPRGPLNPFNVAVDGASGEIYLTDGFGPTVIDQFSAAGAYLGRITGEDTPAGSIYDVWALAVDPASHDVYVPDTGGPHPAAMDVFGPNVVIPDVASEPASNVTASSASLNGTVNPDNAGSATCRFEWGTTEFFGEVSPCEPEAVAESGSPVPVHATLGDLLPDTTYYYRLLAANHNGTNPGEASEDEHFTTPGPGLRHESVSDVAATSVTFDATVDPHGHPASYYFQYGPSSTYGTNVPAPPGSAIGSGEEDVDVHPYHVQGLVAGTIYHYRLVVVSEVEPGQYKTFDGPDATFTTQTAAVSTLPDGRHWEMASPPNKQGATLGGIGETAVVQAAAGGDALAYNGNAPTEIAPQANAGELQVLSVRGADGWTSRDLPVPHEHAPGAGINEGPEFRFFSEDLSIGLLQPMGDFVPGLSPEASQQTPYLGTLAGSCAGSCYRPLVTDKPGYANVPPGTAFGEETNGKCPQLFCGPFFVGATADLRHVILESHTPLVEGAGTGAHDGELYEWTDGKLTLVSVQPGGETSPGGGALGFNDSSSRRAISSDGSRVVWSMPPNGALEMRDLTKKQTIPLSTAEPACVAAGACQGGSGIYQIASSDGSKVFFTDQLRLTGNSGRAGADLYECEIVEGAGPECKLSDLTPAHEGENGEVQGSVLGASEDGSYIYFVANGRFAEKALRGDCAESQESQSRACNLYVRHNGVTKLVTTLSEADRADWSTDLAHMPVRVSRDGRWLEFVAQEAQTSYDSRDALTGQPDAEVYLYDATTGRIVCASCNPTGARPEGVPSKEFKHVGSVPWASGAISALVPGWINYVGGASVYQPRYLANSGRLFFDSVDGLVPQDVNGTEDVYEYEPAGVGDCTSASATFVEHSSGCVGLISSGTSPEASGFVDASESGGDVFFLTLSKLALQDFDNSEDMYDAHECTAAAPCYPPELAQPPECTTAEACRLAPLLQPAIFGAPSSSTFSGAGNIVRSGPGVVAVRPKSATRAQKLAKALRECRRRGRRRGSRGKCERRARARYGSRGSRKASGKKGKR